MISISSLVICAWRGAVIFHGQAIDHVAGVAGGVVHRRHLRAVERGSVLEQRFEDLHGDVERQKIGQDLGLVGLVFVDGAAKGSLGGGVSAEIVAGMICCAVGTWLITERKRE